MHRKTIIYIAGGLLVVAVGILVVCCMRRDNKVYLSLLPHDATAVARLDLKGLVGEAGLTAEDELRLAQRFLNIDDASECGVDFRLPLYAFASASGNYGCIGAVADEQSLTTTCANLAAAGHATAISRQRGLSWAVVKQQWLMAFDDEKVLVMGPAVGAAQEQLRAEMVRLMAQKQQKSGVNSTLFETLAHHKTSVAAVVAPEGMPDGVRTLLNHFDIYSREDALIGLTLQPADNEVSLKVEIHATSEAVEKQLQQMAALMRPVEGALADYAHEGAAAWLTMNVQGKDLLTALRSNANLRTALIALNLVIDADCMITAIDGDISIEVQRLTPAMKKGSIEMLGNTCLAAQVADTAFLSRASSWGNAMFRVHQLTPTDFSLMMFNRPLYFGVNDKVLYLSHQQGLQTAGNDHLRSHDGDLHGARLFATVKASDLLELSGLRALLPEASRHLERIDLHMREPQQWQLQLVAPQGFSLGRWLLLGDEQ